jgi:hypothetical protein
MDPATLLADPTAIRLEKIISDISSLTLVVMATRAEVDCPRCHRPSARVHSYYTRSVADLPWHGVAVRLYLRTRRFRCRNSLCTKRVFCERLPRVVDPYGRKTVRMNEALELLGFLIDGDAGGAWHIMMEAGGWKLREGKATGASVRLDAETAWRLFYNSLDRREAWRRVAAAGDEGLCAAFLAVRSVMV